MIIEPLTQQHALEIANDWHYETPYDFYDMKNDLEDYEEIVSLEARRDRYYQVLREEEFYGFFCLEQKGKRTFIAPCFFCNPSNPWFTSPMFPTSSPNINKLGYLESKASKFSLSTIRPSTSSFDVS